MNSRVMYFDECDKIYELSRSLSAIDWEEAGRLRDSSYILSHSSKYITRLFILESYLTLQKYKLYFY